MHVKLYTYLYFVTACLILACSKSEDNSFEYKYAYYPLQKDFWVIYTVDSIQFTQNGSLVKPDTFRFQVKEYIDSSFVGLDNELYWQISVFSRMDSVSPWSNQRIGLVKRTITTVQRDFNGINLIKLVFPPNKDYSWNTNVFNNESKNSELIDSICVFTEIDKPLSLAKFSFDSSLTVLQADYEDLINKGYSEEKYAKNVGMVYKKILELGKQNASNPWTKPESGYDVTYTIWDYKK